MTPTRSLARRAALLLTAGTAALALTACGGESTPAGPSDNTGAASAPATAPADKHNEADVAFSQGMIPHHRQAVEMAGLAASRASSAEVKKLAEEIEKAQAPEIETMSGWLTAWGEDVPEGTDGAGHGGMDHGSGHGGAGMPGMMSDEQMTGLGKASGKEFDTAFLTMMVAHHEGAVEMAETERKQGLHGPSKDLAADVVSVQKAEIDRMEKLLGKG
ncbi:DUF305 domain-containing protein [Streptomyces sp. NPDC059637]|uniref:DUF305 domain-containing protein n=1 Tax=Streptomyces sp. NPDC059637 TaxID=3347752 RepID=UPI00367B3E34